MVEVQPKKSGQRRWVRYERTYSNSMWHTDYKLLDDGRWFIAYMDDAPRCIIGFGVFDAAAGRHTLEVLGKAMEEHGIPASVLTDRGSQFYANESESKRRGRTEFEKELVRRDIRHVVARSNHPQTNGKQERFHGELQRRLPQVHRRLVPQDRPRPACRPRGGHIQLVGIHGSCGRADQMVQP